MVPFILRDEDTFTKVAQRGGKECGGQIWGATGGLFKRQFRFTARWGLFFHQ
jgi:hypothetical protein